MPVTIDPLVLETFQTISIIDDASILVETFIQGDDRQSVAFVQGLPLPYEIAVAMMMRRIVGSNVIKHDDVLRTQISDRLDVFWAGVRMPASYEKVSETLLGSFDRGYNYVQKLFRTIKKETGAKDALFAVIREMEDRYAASLTSPVQV